MSDTIPTPSIPRRRRPHHTTGDPACLSCGRDAELEQARRDLAAARAYAAWVTDYAEGLHRRAWPDVYGREVRS